MMRSLRTHAVGLVDSLLYRSGALPALGRLAPQGAAVLMYHGVVQAPLPVPDPCFISAATFERQMAYLARHFDVVHVDDILAAGATASQRPRACVTFDDGFAGLETWAWPILRKYRIPATIYLVTGLVDTPGTVWFARLHQTISESRRGEISFQGRTFSLATAEQKADTSAHLQLLLKALPRERFSEALEDLLARLGAPGIAHFVPWDAFRILTRDAVRRMSEDPLIRFGAHTVTHQILTRCSAQIAREEIEQSVQSVAAMVANPSRSFAYPNGGFDDFDAHAIDVLRGNGISCALTTMPGAVQREGEPFAMPRYNVTEGAIASFARAVHRIGDAVRRPVAAPAA